MYAWHDSAAEALLPDEPGCTEPVDLFGEPLAPRNRLPRGLHYQPEFLSSADEAALIALVRGLPLAPAPYKSYTARRRVVAFGGSYDFDSHQLRRGQPLPEELAGLRKRVADWMGVAPSALVQALVSEYAPGTPLGWHRDVPDFEDIAGVSLGTPATLRFRPYPPDAPKRADVVRLVAAPRSIYVLRGAARWAWQHSVAPTPELRWSITWRTARAGSRAASLD